MKNKAINFICIILNICIIATFSGCSGDKIISKNTLPFTQNTISGENFDGEVYQNGKFSIIWNDKFKQVIFCDLEKNVKYSSMPIEEMTEKYDEDGMLIKSNSSLESSIIVYYYEENMISSTNISGSEALRNGEIITEKIDSGIKVTYIFTELEISVPVEYKINEDSFSISVNPTEIADNGENFVTGVAIAPFLCSAKNDDEDSYLFYPDGSGAIIEPKTIDMIGSSGGMRVFGDDLLVGKSYFQSLETSIKLPVFGVKNEKNALLAVISSGDEQAFIDWNVGSGNIGYSSVYSRFVIRGHDLIKRPARFWAATPEVEVYYDGISDILLQVTYYPLYDETANYSGMAKTYRDYLIDNKILDNNQTEQTDAVFKILGGVEKKAFTLGIPHKELFTLTDINQVKEMAEFFSSNLDGNISMSLIGFGNNGISLGDLAGGFNISKQFGSEKEIRDFSKYCKNNQISLYMDFDILAFKSSIAGFSNTFDVARQINGQNAYIKYFNNVTHNTQNDRYVLLKRNKLKEAVQKAVNTVYKYDIEGISLSSLSNTIYSDYTDGKYQVAQNMSHDVNYILSKVSEKQKVLSTAANIYAACESNCVVDAPIKSSNRDIYTYDIPFYEIVLKGYVNLSSPSINLNDSKTGILKCVESGLIPSYTLAYSYDNSIAQLDFTSLFATNYKDQKEDIVKNVKKINSVIELLKDAKIISHQRIAEGVNVTEFDNGIKIAVNYTNTEAFVDDIAVSSKDYTLLEVRQ